MIYERGQVSHPINLPTLPRFPGYSLLTYSNYIQNSHSSYTPCYKLYNQQTIDKRNQMLHKIIILLFITVLTMQFQVQRYPLTYAFDWDLINKLPITVAFNHSNIYSTSPTQQLYLLNYNLSVTIKSFTSHQTSDHIEIGLQYPSDFVSAMASAFKISYQDVQFGKSDFLQVILFDDNYIQSQDIFVESADFRVHVKFNYGDDLFIDEKPCRLIDGKVIYFEEYLIRQALTKIGKENMINFKFHEDNSTITLIGELSNIPQFTLVRGDYIFKLKIQGNIINYIRAVDNIQRQTLIGYKSLYQFNKFKFSQNDIIFKRTTLVYQLYLYVAYFSIISLLLVILSKKNLFQTGIFLKHILQWVLFKSRASKLEVLKSQLE